jgi:hypothetical protein
MGEDRLVARSNPLTQQIEVVLVSFGYGQLADTILTLFMSS